MVERSDDGRVFRSRGGTRAYGCLFSTNRLVRLGTANEGYWLSGRYVAYSQTYDEGEGGGRHDLFVVDLRRNKNRRVEPVWFDADFGVSREEQQGVPGRITDLTLKRNGSVAWISCSTDQVGGPCNRAEPYQVWRSDRRGARLLDESRDVASRSLRREVSTLTWLRGEIRRTATLK